MKRLILADGTPFGLVSMELSTVGNNFTEITLHHCSLPVDTSHIKLLEIISLNPSLSDRFLLYQKFIECSVRASSSQLELFIENLNDFTLIARFYESSVTDDPKIYSKILLDLL